VVTGSDYCLWHAPDQATREKARQLRQQGGRKRARQLAGPATAALDASDLDLATLDGLVQYTARALTRLATLPFDVKVANAIGQLVNVQRAALEVSSLDARLTALEHAIGGKRAA
jgi:hypothetical protein